MRFVHAADIHLDSPLRELSRQDVRQVERMQRAGRAAFERLIDLCIEQEAAFLLLAGDLYDHDCPDMQIAVFLRNQLRRLDQQGIRAVIIKGNHDAANRITSALSLPPNTRVIGDLKPESLTYDDLPVRVSIHGQSFKPGPVADNLAASYPPPLRGHYNIGLLHTSLAGNADHDPYAPCSLDELTSRSYDYWALGHIHKGAVLAREPWVIFPGNLQGRDAKETGPKGCYVVEVDDGGRTVAADFAPLDVVRWLRTDVDLHGEVDEAALVECIRAALHRANRERDGRPAAICILLTGRTALYGHIARAPQRLRQTTLELADEIAGDDIWIEKIKNETTPIEHRHDAANPHAHDLIRIMRNIAGDTALVGPLLTRELELLRTKLPGELKELPCLKLLENPSLCGPALDRLEPQLVARLAGEEDV